MAFNRAALHPQPDEPKRTRSASLGWAAGGLLLLGLLVAGCLSGRHPTTPRDTVTDVYHGTPVADPYRWLERSSDPAVHRWTEAQNAQARAVLDRSDSRPLIEARLRDFLSARMPSYGGLAWGGDRLFFMEAKPPAQQPMLKSLQGTNTPDRAELILDPGELEPKGSSSIDWFVPSPNGSLVAVSLSEGGSERGSVRFFKTAGGTALADSIGGVNGATAGGSVAWNSDGTGVYYTRYPRKGERPDADLDFYQQVYFHKLGTAADADTYEIGREFPRVGEVVLSASPDHRWILASVANGDGGEFAHWLRSADGKWTQVTRFTDGIHAVKFGRDPVFIEWPSDDGLYLLSHSGAPKGKVLRVPLGQPSLASATVAVPEGKFALVDFHPSASGMYLSYINGGPMELRFLDGLGKTNRLISPRPGGAKSGTNEVYESGASAPAAIQGVLVTRGDEVLFRTETFTEPYRWHRYDPGRDAERVDTVPLAAESPADFGDIEVVRTTAPSKDGTEVPISILRKRGIHLDGRNPVLLTGYGGYGISITPRFDFTRRIWFDQGGVLAVANLRGGGELGEDWHTSGNLTRKQNVFDDLIACAEFLIRSNYTRPSLLAIEGGSNGGLLMGAALTQRPELFQAVVSHVGIYDSLRCELDPNGEFNITEFGSVKDEAQFRALHAYSPYHHVNDGIDYPAVLMMTGENDGRVNPAHSRKMTARLQAATRGKRPVLLRTSANTGHGMGTPLSARMAEIADVYAFLFDQLGIYYSRVDRGPLSGAITPHTADVKATLVNPGMKATLLLSEKPNLAHARRIGPVESGTNQGNTVDFPLEGLKPDTRYHYALEIDGKLEPSKHGEFRTFPEGRASFTIAFASCAKTGSANESFDRIRENDPLFYMNTGDFHYLNISTNLRSKFRAGYDSVLASPAQAELYRHVPLVYMWDDHDFGGNGSSRVSSSHEAARLTYQERVPHYPLGAGTGNVPIYQSFAVGRVKFILTDLRSERDSVTNKDDATKSMMGTAQKEWFKQELLSARGKYPLICWVSSVPWLGEKGSNYYRGVATNQFGYIHHTLLTNRPSRTTTNASSGSTNAAPRGGRGGRGGGGPPQALDEDHWSVFATERREIADFIKSNHISGVCILHGDSHMLAADDGRNGDFATGGGAPIPVMCAAPLDQDPSLKGGPYSEGVYKVKKGEGCFGLLTVTDQGDSIQVAFSGRNNKNEEKVHLKFSVPAQETPQPIKKP